jgi:small nuclear ribonucleoprotein (snRNP)-like protein
VYEQFQACSNCINRRVALHTVGGAVHEGVIVNIDERNVYLDTSRNLAYSQAGISSKKKNKKTLKKAKTSGLGFGFGGRQTILTLALFDLLAIALLV